MKGFAVIKKKTPFQVGLGDCWGPHKWAAHACSQSDLLLRHAAPARLSTDVCVWNTTMLQPSRSTRRRRKSASGCVRGVAQAAGSVVQRWRAACSAAAAVPCRTCCVRRKPRKRQQRCMKSLWSRLRPMRQKQVTRHLEASAMGRRQPPTRHMVQQGGVGGGGAMGLLCGWPAISCV
jgi:hypothetical protein